MCLLRLGHGLLHNSVYSYFTFVLQSLINVRVEHRNNLSIITLAKDIRFLSTCFLYIFFFFFCSWVPYKPTDRLTAPVINLVYPPSLVQEEGRGRFSFIVA
jgi:hypothetical protein